VLLRGDLFGGRYVASFLCGFRGYLASSVRSLLFSGRVVIRVFCSGCLLGAWSVVPVVAFLESGLSLSSLWFRGRFPRPFLVVLVVCGFDAFVSGCAVGGRMVAWAMFSRGLSFSLLSIDILTLREAYKHATVG